MDFARTNVFRLCSGLRVIGYVMILVVGCIVALSYYAVVVVVWGPRIVEGGGESVLGFVVVVAFHILLALLIWSYSMVVFHDPGAVPPNWRPLLVDESLQVSAAQSDYVADEVRPSTSEEFERRSTVYTFLGTVLDTLALLPNFVKFFGDARKHSSSPGDLAVTFLAFVLNFAFALSLLCFVVMHTSLLLSNTTSIEVYEKKKVVVWKYDLGKYENFKQVFGTKRLLWFLPLYSADDFEKIPALQGLDFPTRSDVES